MNLLREYIILSSQNEVLKDPRYITEVLGIQIPLHESYPFSVGLEARILHEHMLLEGFFDGLKKLKDDALLFGKSVKEIFTNPDRIGAFVGAINKNIIRRITKPIKSFFKMIMEKFPKAMKEKFPTFVKAAESVLAFIDGVIEKVKGMSGWKQALATMALALGMKFIWNQVGELIQKGKDKLMELIPFFGEFDAIAAAGLKEDDESGGKLEKAKEAIMSFVNWFKDKIMGQVVDFVKDKLKEIGTSIVGSAIAGGVKEAWETLKAAYGGAKFVMGTLAPAFKRFGRSSKQDGKIAKESLVRECIRGLLAETDRAVEDDRRYGPPPAGSAGIDPKMMQLILQADDANYHVDISDSVVRIYDGSKNKIAAVSWYEAGLGPTFGPCLKADIVNHSDAIEDMGPLAYDIAIEVTGGLVSDRTEVSDEAERVWDYYMNNRSDVQSQQLDIMPDYGVPQLTPRNKADDCDQIPAHTKYGEDWHRSGLSKKFFKQGTPVMDELRRRGML